MHWEVILQYPLFELFSERLIGEQYKLMQLYYLSTFNNQYCVAHTSKGKHKTLYNQK